MISTENIFDESRVLLHDLYESRLELAPIRAKIETRMYHLPTGIAFSGAPQCSEVDLLRQEHISSTSSRDTCKWCNQVRPLYGVHSSMCLECWSIHVSLLWREFPVRIQNWTQIISCASYIQPQYMFILNEPGVKMIKAATLRELIQEFRKCICLHPRSSLSTIEVWSTPKKAFMAMEVGCVSCGKHMDRDQWLWSADASSWGNGYCPSCRSRDPRLDKVWDLTDAEYRGWQNSYTTQRLLQRTIARYGSLSLLLVSPGHDWARYVSKVVPHDDKMRYRGGGVLTPKAIGSIHSSGAKTLDQLGIDLDNVLDPIRGLLDVRP